jgi:hypothetical protein
MKLASLRLATAFAAAVLSAHAYTETWSVNGDSAGWTAFAVATTSAVQQDFAGGLELTAANYTSYYAIADATASGGAFVGSYAGYALMNFDLTLDAAATVDALAVRLYDSVSGHDWTYALSYTLGNLLSFSVPVDGAGAGWTQQAGPAEGFSALLGAVEELAFVFTANDAVDVQENLKATLDNVTLVAIPEPGSAAALAGVLALAFGAGRRRRA